MTQGRLGRYVDYLRNLLERSVSLIVLLVAWEAIARSGMLTSYLLPAPSAICVRLWTMAIGGGLFVDLAYTLWRSIIGFALGAAIGVPLGILMARVRIVEWLLDPIVSIGFPMPKIAFMPIFILWFGLFDGTKVLMIAFHAVFPVISATWSGARSVERSFIWSARSMGVSERQTMWDVVLPATVPSIMTGLQVAMPMALITAIVTEFLMGGTGIGATMINSSRYADSTGVFAGIVAIAILGVAVMRVIQLVRTRLLHWHQETQVVTA